MRIQRWTKTSVSDVYKMIQFEMEEVEQGKAQKKLSGKQRKDRKERSKKNVGRMM